MDAITAALVSLKIDTNNAQKYAQKLWEQGVTTPGLLAAVDKDILGAAGITTPVHVKVILAGAKSVSLAAITAQDEMKYDAFLTHNWGGGNHEKVSEINKVLKREGIRTWFDEEKMSGHGVLDDMTRGIDQSNKVVVFVTRTYMEKVMGDDKLDNCKREFLYADKTKGGSVGMIPVVMEDGMRKHSEWKGVLGMVLGDAIHHDLSPSVVGAAREKNIKALVTAIKGKTLTDGNTGGAVKPHVPTDLSTINGMSATEIVGLLKVGGAVNLHVPADSSTISGMSATEIVQLLKVEGTKNAELAAMYCEKIGQVVKGDGVRRMQFVNAGACEQVVTVLHAWMKTDGLVVQWACAAIKVLSRGDTEKALLGGLGACEAVVAALIAWGNTDAQVAEQGCGAVYNLSNNNDANKTRLGSTGACEAVVAVLLAWGNTDARVAEQGCSAVRNLSNINNANKTRLGNTGACEVVVAALLAWGNTDARVAEWGCRAVQSLVTNSAANKQRLIKVGAVVAVQGTMSNNSRDDALKALRG